MLKISVINGLQSRYTQAQTDQIQAEIEAMSLKELLLLHQNLIFNKRSYEIWQ
jgi:hypothetical protein